MPEPTSGPLEYFVFFWTVGEFYSFLASLILPTTSKRKSPARSSGEYPAHKEIIQDNNSKSGVPAEEPAESCTPKKPKMSNRDGHNHHYKLAEISALPKIASPAPASSSLPELDRTPTPILSPAQSTSKIDLPTQPEEEEVLVPTPPLPRLAHCM